MCRLPECARVFAEEWLFFGVCNGMAANNMERFFQSIHLNIEVNGLKKALHIVRGHPVTYTKEKPLFGKYSGTFWKPAHARGSIEQGAVLKDYKVNAPQSKPPTSKPHPPTIEKALNHLTQHIEA